MSTIGIIKQLHSSIYYACYETKWMFLYSCLRAISSLYPFSSMQFINISETQICGSYVTTFFFFELQFSFYNLCPRLISFILQIIDYYSHDVLKLNSIIQVLSLAINSFLC